MLIQPFIIRNRVFVLTWQCPPSVESNPRGQRESLPTCQTARSEEGGGSWMWEGMTGRDGKREGGMERWREEEDRERGKDGGTEEGQGEREREGEGRKEGE